MHKKALIYDLDNTIYPVASIGKDLFAPLYALIQESGQFDGSFDQIQDDIMRRPFQVVARHYRFSRELTSKGIALLGELSYEGPIRYFADYPQIRSLPGERFLVTTGFRKLQESKIRGMGIAGDFKEVIIVDPATSDKTKKDVFADIMQRYGYQPREVLVIGDDPESEIKAAGQLGIDTVLYDKDKRYNQAPATFHISDFGELKLLLQGQKAV